MFGSLARETTHSSSDIDLVIIKNTSSSLTNRLREVARVVKSWEAMDILIYTPLEWQSALKQHNMFISEIDSKGKILYER